VPRVRYQPTNRVQVARPLPRCSWPHRGTRIPVTPAAIEPRRHRRPPGQCPQEGPLLGPVTLRKWLVNRGEDDARLPAPSRIGSMLKRHGLVRPRQRRRRTPTTMVKPASKPRVRTRSGASTTSARSAPPRASTGTRSGVPLLQSPRYPSLLSYGRREPGGEPQQNGRQASSVVSP
jgi:hypothetical protein